MIKGLYVMDEFCVAKQLGLLNSPNCLHVIENHLLHLKSCITNFFILVSARFFFVLGVEYCATHTHFLSHTHTVLTIFLV